MDGKTVITAPKTRKSRRTIYLTDEYVAMLDRHYVRWLEFKMKHRDKWQDEYDLMFCTRHGTAIGPNNLLRNFRSALKRAGLEDFRFHDLRHTANQAMKDAGVDAKVRAAILGHAGIKVNEEIYTHVSETEKRDALQKASRKLG